MRHRALSATSVSAVAVVLLLAACGGSSSGPPASIGSGSSLEVYNNALKTQSLLGRLNYKAGW